MSKPNAPSPATSTPAASAPAPSSLPEPAPVAPSSRAGAKTLPEPTFSDGGAGAHDDPGVMTVNPTPREGRAPEFPRGTGPTPMQGEDMARRGGGADQRVEERQGGMADKYRKDPAIQKLMKDEALKRFGELPDAGPGSEGERGGAPAAANAQRTQAKEEPSPAAAARPDDVAEIARAQRENRELKQRIKAAEGSRTEAKRLEAWRQIAKDYPIAAMREVLGLEPDAIYQDDVQGRSKGADPERLKVDPAALVAEEDKRAGRDVELEDAKRVAREAAAELAFERSQRGAAAIAREDAKRWELCNRDPDIGHTVTREVQRLLGESDKQAGGAGKGWRPKDDTEARELTESILDDLEKHYDAQGKRYSRTPAAAPAAAPSQRPTPPPGQGRPSMPTPGEKPLDNYRYSKAPKRVSVEDRQDALIERYRGVSLTDADS